MSLRRLAAVLVVLGATASAQDIEAYHRYRQVFEASSRPVEALEKAVAEVPDEAWAHHFLCRARMEARDLAGARTAIAAALKISPREPFHHETLGQVSLQAGDASAAASALRTAASLEQRPEPKGWMTEQAQRVEASKAAVEEAAATGRSALMLALLTTAIGVFIALRRSRP